MSARCIAIAVAALASLGAPGASAQVYRCSSGGTAYLSDRPCGAAAANPPPTPSRPTLGAVGPLPQRQAFTRDYHPSMPKASEHLSYLGPECASLNEAIRTGPARGLRGTAMSDLHAEYRSKCAEEEAEAYRKLSRDRQDQRLARRQEQVAEQAELQRSQRERDQCAELLRILHGKRQRLPAMSSGEKADFERSEATYHARCPAR